HAIPPHSGTRPRLSRRTTTGIVDKPPTDRASNSRSTSEPVSAHRPGRSANGGRRLCRRLAFHLTRAKGSGVGAAEAGKRRTIAGCRQHSLPSAGARDPHRDRGCCRGGGNRQGSVNRIDRSTVSIAVEEGSFEKRRSGQPHSRDERGT